MDKARVSVVVAALAGALLLSVSPASADEGAAAAGRKVDSALTQAVQRHLKSLGFASVVVDGRSSREFKNILCSWREAVGKPLSRKQLLPAEADRILDMTQLPKPARGLAVGLNVNKTCQSMAIVKKQPGQPRQYGRIFRVSTGVAGFDTSPGLHVIQRRIDGLHNSTGYPSPSGWNMYRPAYFTSWGEAFHGSPSDTSVSWAPSSHGCVRMLQKDIDYLWRSGANSIGTQVYVYGSWQG